MLQQESLVVVADNTQAKKAKIIRVLKGSYGKIAHVGDRVVVRAKKEIARKDGTYIRFADNAVVLLTKDAKGNMNPIGKRVFGPVARELREKYRPITNMAEEVL